MAQSPSQGTFLQTGNLINPRSQHSATLLYNGKVLIAGGWSGSGYLASAELYDPLSGTFTKTGDMVTSRCCHAATLLPDGRVLISGGVGPTLNSPLRSAEIYDPSTGIFTGLGNLTENAVRSRPTATLLPTGKVLIASIDGSARLFDPQTNSFSGSGPSPWFTSTATQLPDGRVLLTGCNDFCEAGEAQIYDPATDSFSPTAGSPLTCRPGECWFLNVNTATLMPNGKTLIVGSNEYSEPADAVTYDASRSAFTSLGHTPAPHEFSTATLLTDGRVLIAGSQLPGGAGDSRVDTFNPDPDTFIPAGNMLMPRHSHTATLLPDSTVLIAGGNSVWPGPTSTAEIFRPPQLSPTPKLFAVSSGRQGAILHGLTHQLVSVENPAAGGEVIEVYAAGLTGGGAIPPRVAIGGRLAEILYFGAAPGWPELNQVNVRVPEGLAPGAIVPVRLEYLSRFSNEVTIAVR